MVNQKEVAKSFCLFFISIYILYLLYSTVGGYINTTLSSEIVPSTVAMNAITNATMALSDFSGMSWFVIVIIVGGASVIISFIFLLFGSRSMGAAY